MKRLMMIELTNEEKKMLDKVERLIFDVLATFPNTCDNDDIIVSNGTGEVRTVTELATARDVIMSLAEPCNDWWFVNP